VLTASYGKHLEPLRLSFCEFIFKWQ